MNHGRQRVTTISVENIREKLTCRKASFQITCHHRTAVPLPHLDIETIVIQVKLIILNLMLMCVCCSQMTIGPVDFNIMCDNTTPICVFGCWQIFSPTLSKLRGVRVSSQSNTLSSHWLNIHHFIEHDFCPHLFKASLLKLYWTAPSSHLCPYILKYLQCPPNTNHQNPLAIVILRSQPMEYCWSMIPR